MVGNSFLCSVQMEITDRERAALLAPRAISCKGSQLGFHIKKLIDLSLDSESYDSKLSKPGGLLIRVLRAQAYCCGFRGLTSST